TNMSDNDFTELDTTNDRETAVNIAVSLNGKTSERTEVSENIADDENIHLILGSDLARCPPVIDRPLIAVAHAVVELCGAGSTFRNHAGIGTFAGNDAGATLECRELLNAEKDFLAEALRLISAMRIYDDKQKQRAA